MTVPFKPFQKRLLAGTLAAASLAAGFMGGEYLKTRKEQCFTGGSRTAVVDTADFGLGKTCSYVLYEDGAAQVKESHLRLFRDNKADVQEALNTVSTWVNAPEPSRSFDYPSPIF